MSYKVYQITIIRSDQAYEYISYHKGTAWSAVMRAHELIEERNKDKKKTENGNHLWTYSDIHKI